MMIPKAVFLAIDGMRSVALEAADCSHINQLRNKGAYSSDHGGHARTHGTESPDDMVIPWFMVGPNIRVAHEVASPVCLLDIAPTFARILEITPHSEWEGHCIDEAFKTEVESNQILDIEVKKSR